MIIPLLSFKFNIKQANIILQNQIIQCFAFVQQKNNPIVKIINKFACMADKKKKYLPHIFDTLSDLDEIHSPFRTQQKIFPKTISHHQSSKNSFVSLFRGETEREEGETQAQGIKEEEEDSFVYKIINRTIVQRKKTQLLQKIPQQNPNEEEFCFNNFVRISYPQTPRFKSLLQSPFSKFNDNYKNVIQQLTQDTDHSYKFNPIQKNANPNDYFFEGGRFFIGIALTMKKYNYIFEALFFMKLACYTQPFRSQIWDQYIELVERQGNIFRVFTLAKTAFLFTFEEKFAKKYLQNGQKCGVPIEDLCGLLSCVKNWQIYEKEAWPQLAKLQLKYGKSIKGIQNLFNICKLNQFKLNIWPHILLLAKFLENIGERRIALNLLRKSFNKSMSKLELYTTYFQMKIRQNGENSENGRKFVRKEDIEELKLYLPNVSNENKYKLCLLIAESLYDKDQRKFNHFVMKSFQLASEYCKDAGYKKAVKSIYYSITKWKGFCPEFKQYTDQAIFQRNRYNFLNDLQLIQNYEFTEWKYYLHYGLTQNTKILYAASQMWPQAGRLISEWIHSLRAKKKHPLKMLKLWRQKIDEVPKSGELWCEGGRIYAQLHEYKNALKCFKLAIHFTPQYGDSFVEALRIYLQQSLFLQSQRLKKVFIVSEPYYGNVLSYIKLNNPDPYRVSMKQVWQHAVKAIQKDLYRWNIRSQEVKERLTAYEPYNAAYLSKQRSREQKEWLFASCQQMDNKRDKKN